MKHPNPPSCVIQKQTTHTLTFSVQITADHLPTATLDLKNRYSSKFCALVELGQYKTDLELSPYPICSCPTIRCPQLNKFRSHLLPYNPVYTTKFERQQGLLPSRRSVSMYQSIKSSEGSRRDEHTLHRFKLSSCLNTVVDNPMTLNLSTAKEDVEIGNNRKPGNISKHKESTSTTTALATTTTFQDKIAVLHNKVRSIWDR